MQDILNGVRILDLTTVIAGPFATQMLADLGADVIKVERPDGDTVRRTGPGRSASMSALFLNANRNKRSIVLDLKHPLGVFALMRLVAKCDVLIHNIRPNAMARLGLSFDELKAVKPDIIHLAVVGYGSNGPYAAYPAYDDMIQAAVAIPALTLKAGSPTPRYVPLAIADRVASMAAANACLAALLRRQRTQTAQDIEIPMFETMAQLVLGDHLSGRTFVPPVSEAGYARLLAHNRRPYSTSDGVICALIYNDKNWRDFLKMVGKSDLFETDSRFNSIASRTNHIEELYALAADEFRKRPTADWLTLLTKADIPVMPFVELDALCDDPHLHASGAIRSSTHPTEGEHVVLPPPTRWRDAPPFKVTRPAPGLGEHGREVLLEAGFSAREISQLHEQGATGTHCVAEQDSLSQMRPLVDS